MAYALWMVWAKFVGEPAKLECQSKLVYMTCPVAHAHVPGKLTFLGGGV